MIDYIEIKLRNFSGHFDNCEYVGDKYEKSIYRLYNHEEGKKIHMMLTYSPDTKTLTLSNSIRKWTLGGFSLLDLSSNNLKVALKKISRKLGITFEEIRKATFTKCEIGLNIRTRHPAYEVIPMIVKYSTFKRYYYSSETVKFKGTDLSLKIYDKCEELLVHNKSYDKKSKRAAFNKLSEVGVYFLRVEFNLFDNQSFINKGLMKIKTVGDIVDNFFDLYDFWTQEISRIVLLNKLVMSKNMTPKQYLIARVLEIDGYESFELSCIKRSEKNARSRIINEALEVIATYNDLKKYNTKKFKLDIFKSLKRIKKREKELDINLMLQNLNIK